MSDEKKEITAEQLLGRLRSDKEQFILDVRTEEDYEAWRVEDIKTPETVNIPYIDFIEEPEEMTVKVPVDKEVVVLCGKGGASDYVADILRKSGRDAVNIIGGMKAWGRLYKELEVYSRDGVKVVQRNRVGKGCLSYILVSGSDAAIIDPARHTDYYAEYLKENGLTLRYVFDTHLHADHISGAAGLRQATGADYYIRAGDMDGATLDFKALNGGEKFNLGGADIEVVSVDAPGHTPGSALLLFDGNVLFTGDTLFVSSMGRPDLGGHAAEWVKDLYNTIQGLDKYGPDTLILPAHTAGPSEYENDGRVAKTLGSIRQSNELMGIAEEEEFSKRVLAHLPEQPEAYQDMRKTNLGVLTPDEDKMELWELGKNRCAIEAAEEAKGEG